ncbi:MAG: radical SAM protein [Proteobacteria bacterium]|nr:radical SAM protein [Pseudomonadota bacterium]
MMEKILVIKPQYKTFPVGFAYVLACLETNNVPFDFVDTDLEPDYAKRMRNNDYLAVATGGLIGQFSFFCDVANTVRKIKPDLPVILGGNITKDIQPGFLFDKIGADYGIVGEAETSLPYLINAIANKSDKYDDIPGLIFRDASSGRIVKNVSKRLNIKDNNILPAWHFFDIDYYSQDFYLPFWGSRSAMPILSGRGCVGQCTFCSPTIGSFRMRPIEHVIEEIKFLNSSYNFEWIVFFNEMFYPSKKEIMEFCEAYRDIKPQKPWVCALRVDAKVDVDTFIAMREAGCVSTSAGIESGSDKVLHLMRKRSTNEQIRKFFRNTREAKLECNGTFMVGNEGETEEDIKQTIDMIISEEMNTSESLTSAYPGTQIYANALKRGLIENEWDYLRQLRFACGVWDYDWVDRSNYLNISDIPDERFWEVMVKELRRYNTFLLNRFQAKSIKYKVIFGVKMKVQGVCCECGSSVTLMVRNSLVNSLAGDGFCPNCFNRVIFNLFKLSDFSDHFNFLCKELEKTHKLVIFGTGPDACELLRFDYFGLNYEKIAGFLEIEPQISNFLFINMPRLKFSELASVQPDTILVADDPLGDAELLLRRYYSKRCLALPRIIHLMPDSKRFSLRITHLICRFFEDSPGAIYRLILAVLIQAIKFFAWLNMKSFDTLKYLYHHPYLKTKRLRKILSIAHKWRRQSLTVL